MNKLLPKLRNVVHDLQKIKKEKGFWRIISNCIRDLNTFLLLPGSPSATLVEGVTDFGSSK